VGCLQIAEERSYACASFGVSAQHRLFNGFADSEVQTRQAGQTWEVNERDQECVVHHFDQVPKSEGNLAVDTATGQMCKTWEWACAKPGYYNNYTKEWVENSSYGVNCAAIATMPTCESISKK